MAVPDREEARHVEPGGQCSCVTDPFGGVPAELRPSPRKKGSLRQITCASCGKEYWANRQGDLCLDCEKQVVT